MHPSAFRSLTAIAAGSLVLALAACSPDADDPAEELGPLDVMFEDLYGDWSQEDGDAMNRQVEELTARCMAEEGFDYSPVDHSGSTISYSSDDLDVEWGTLEFAEQYGYGITTDPWGHEDEDRIQEMDGWSDPNQEYVEAMSDTERDAYYEALHGPGIDESEFEDGQDVEWDWTQGGCQGWAQHQVYEGGADGEEYETLQAEIMTMWETMQADPRVTAVEAEWASCMADAGHPGLTATGEAEEQFYEQVNAAYDSIDYDAMSETEMEEFDWEAHDAAVKAELAALTPREIETAVADYTCREEVDYDATFREVNFELQQDVVDRHGPEIEAWIESMRAARTTSE
ncbi:hypothetical protein [Cellulomonas bogoriensis]|uniref:Lipoprotein n=1 Tax=Cellulomonas bogoriensis 69B4 = DSM 16987 TaxID=1386082 RepID=A0A0A0C1E6_9CELL|nr:hypothetical protein [Cellulomonas bogoriensis]KGM14020.1 hypothetical protein N869_06580 [Cellulomonas bogoriensis 69B4 = DSM 16987]